MSVHGSSPFGLSAYRERLDAILYPVNFISSRAPVFRFQTEQWRAVETVEPRTHSVVPSTATGSMSEEAFRFGRTRERSAKIPIIGR
jgi:hypothetical protein